ncbi:hypothetical protein SeMB42_g06803 [Synchytrium endobioticum]|uniref:Uncharacterized protein n=1 Tax=Synchytrium endobioticum TaxID=286115 RepID=A0A507CJD0_9FUNG|nr:hypothetical protein SeMB42_g06803 [Synchytrium endobioticum]TPX39858.1 hypothetical protein SeLEV6574_g06948 [Synchytrium endobioticum]
MCIGAVCHNDVACNIKLHTAQMSEKQNSAETSHTSSSNIITGKPQATLSTFPDWLEKERHSAHPHYIDHGIHEQAKNEGSDAVGLKSDIAAGRMAADTHALAAMGSPLSYAERAGSTGNNDPRSIFAGKEDPSMPGGLSLNDEHKIDGRVGTGGRTFDNKY